MRKILLLTVMVVGLFAAAIAQTKPINGKVIDKDGKPIDGATIAVKGHLGGVAADADGSFKISVKSGDVLIVSAIGHAIKQVKVSNQTTFNVVLESDDATMGEVVVTAMGIKRNRNTLPYAAQQISGDDLNKAATTLNPVENLSGKVAGLQITQASTMGGSTNVILRGIKSLTQSNQALFVVDGVPYDNSNQSNQDYDLGNAASDINPDDIASVSVLKGAAASALYGSRASNGVIMITTKKSSKKKGLGVTASFGVSVGSPDKSTLPVYQTQYGEGYGSVGSTNTGNPNPFFYYQPTSFSNGKNVSIVQTDFDAGTGPAYDPTLMVYNWQSFTPGDPNFGKASPWVPAAHHNPTDYFVTPVTTSASVNVNGSDEKATFKLGFKHDDNKDFMPNSYLKKNAITFSSTYSLTDQLSVGGSIDYSDNAATNRYLYPYTGGSSPMTDFRQWWPTNVDINQLKDDYNRNLTNATWNWQQSAYLGNKIGSIGTPAYHDNPYWFSYKNFENDSRNRYFGNIHLDYTINSYLSATGRISKDDYTQTLETRQDVGSQNTSSYFRYNGTYDETNYDLMVNLNKDLNKDFNLKALIGGNVRQTVNQSIYALTSGGLVVPGFFALANSKNTPAAPVEYYGAKEVDGVYANATLSYQELLTLDASLRRDHSSTLPSNNNSYNYPSASLNFQFGKLLPKLDWLSHGKVWTNYAEVGSDAPIFSLANTYISQTPFNSQTMYSTPSTNNNPNLVPERQKQYEFGVEASFLKDRLGFNLAYYHAQQINQIMPTSVSTSTGFSHFYVNGGAIQNSGVELSLNLVPVKIKNFTWDMNINWSKNEQKVLSLYNGQAQYLISNYQNSIRLVAKPGKAYQLQGTDYVYLNGQREIDATGHYVIASNIYSDLGTPNPDWIGGINNSFKYKNIALSFLVDVRHGGKVYSLDMDYGSSSGLYPRTAGYNDLGNPVRSPLTGDSKSGGIILKGVTSNGAANKVRIDESDIGLGNYSFSSAYGEADREFVYDASYIKLRELAITYSLPSKFFSKNAGFIKGLDFSISGRNLWIIQKNLPYADPEQGQASGNASMGFQNGAYPTIRTIGANIKVKF